MMAVRARAAAVMAALDRRVPSLDEFAGQSWSSWVERADISVADGTEAEECHRNEKKKEEAMTLIKEDMAIFGHCPAHDDFFLVVCNHCSQVVKPQAFEKHCERRHGPLSKLYARLHPAAGSSPPTPLQKSRSGNSQSTCTASKASRERQQAQSQQKSTKGQKDSLCLFVPVVNLEKMPPITQPESTGVKLGTQANTPSLTTDSHSPAFRDSPTSGASRPHGSTPPKGHVGKGGTDAYHSEKPQSRKGDMVTAKTPESHSGHRTYKKISKKECDLDKHCGVMDPEKKKVCTRLLTCKIHSIHQRREVAGRTKDFDQLVAELKAGAKARETSTTKDKSNQMSRDGCVHRAPSRDGSPETPVVPMKAPHCRRRLTNCMALRSRASSESDQEQRGEDSNARPLYPFLMPCVNSRLSSEESDGQEEEMDKPDWHYSSRHPTPQATCTFGSHALGRGCFVFDRRLDRVRSALCAMMEPHINSHMWKKIPQVSDLQSQRTSAPAVSMSSSSQHSAVTVASLPAASALRTSPSCFTSSAVAKESRSQHCTAASPNPGTACGLSDSAGGNSQSIMSPMPANTPSPSSLSRASTPVAKGSRSTKLKWTLMSEQNTVSRKRKKPPPGETDASSHKKNCLLQDGGRSSVSGTSEQPQKSAPSPHGPLNGALSPGNKQRHHSSPVRSSLSPGLVKRNPHHYLDSSPVRTPHSSDSGFRSKPVNSNSSSNSSGKSLNCDPKGFGKKQKNGPPPPEHKPAKPNRSSTNSDSSFLHKKRDGKGVISTGLEKKLGVQKSKLHH
ncbi:ataxin-7-like protein 2 [Erpetoichthys calabaricus]|uniref:ataxin-7-like protein 2 n=1 Tax=Erpetoichthys calabaricus TaxID=27687 RepID=UPI0022345EC7|nr:ataxin-7-like protein 2 [Erpetoichthys calabaricus]